MDRETLQEYKQKRNDYKFLIKQGRDELRNLQVKLKNTRTKLKNKSLPKAQRDQLTLDEESQNRAIQNLKQKIIELKEEQNHSANKLINENPELKKCILFSQGKVFDTLITSSKEKIRQIETIQNYFAGQSTEQVNLKKKATEYLQKIVDNNKAKQLAATSGGITIDARKLETEKKAILDEMEKCFDELQRKAPIGSRMTMDFKSFLQVLENVEYNGNIDESLNDYKGKVSDKLKWREECLRGIIRDAEENLHTRFEGFANDEPRELSVTVQPKWYFKIPFIGRKLRESAIYRATEEQKQIRNSFATYNGADNSSFRKELSNEFRKVDNEATKMANLDIKVIDDEPEL